MLVSLILVFKSEKLNYMTNFYKSWNLTSFSCRVWVDIWREAWKHWILFKPKLPVLQRGVEGPKINGGGSQIRNGDIAEETLGQHQEWAGCLVHEPSTGVSPGRWWVF